MEIMNRVVLPLIDIPHSKGKNINNFFQQLKKYASNNQFVQALDLARQFVWKSGSFKKGRQADCHDVIHLLADNNVGSKHFVKGNVLEEQFSIKAGKTFMGPLTPLDDNVNKYNSNNLESYILESIETSLDKNVNTYFLPNFLFLSDPDFDIDYKETITLNDEVYILKARICSQTKDGLHFWSHINDDITKKCQKIDNLTGSISDSNLPLHGIVENTILVLYINSSVFDDGS
jgi:hypothetical protein